MTTHFETIYNVLVRWLICALVTAACSDSGAPSVTLNPIPTIADSLGQGLSGLSFEYRTDEANELWAVGGWAIHFQSWNRLFRYDRAEARWSEVESEQYRYVFSTAGDGRLLVGVVEVGAPTLAPRWHYLAPGATTLGAPIVAAIDLDGDGLTNDLQDGVMDAAGRFYALARGEGAIVRVEPGSSVATPVLDLDDIDLVGGQATAEGEVIFIHRAKDIGTVIDRFGADGSGPHRVVARCDDCVDIPTLSWDWFTSDAAYRVANEPGGDGNVYRLTRDGSYTFFANGHAGEYVGTSGLVPLDEDSLLTFMRTEKQPRVGIIPDVQGGLLVRDIDGDPSGAWTQIADTPLLAPVLGRGPLRWVRSFDKLYELKIGD